MNDVSTGTGHLSAILRRDRALVLGGLTVLSLLAWVYTIQLSRGMSHASGMMEAAGSPQMAAWRMGDLALLFLMWTVMMAAMMIPSAAGMVLTLAAISRRRGDGGGPMAPAATFLLGYVIIWTAFSFVGTLTQWALHDAALVSPMGASTSAVFGGSLLIIAGVFQWTPFKDACLTKCRSPLGFLLTRWRPGARGALVMGIEHGLFCVGCCWAIMGLMFIAGMMNILWLAAIALFCLIEKVAPYGRLAGQLAGAALIVWGIYILQIGL